MKIKFLQQRTVLDGLEGTDRETSFKEGQIVDLPDRSAKRWLDRGIAELVPAEVKAAPADSDQETKKPKVKA